MLGEMDWLWPKAHGVELGLLAILGVIVLEGWKMREELKSIRRVLEDIRQTLRK